MKREIILLPSLLLASGFESLNTRDIKFLNNYRKHFDKTKYNLEEIFIVTESDYELGGIMNPYNQMTVPTSLYELCKSKIKAFPYATRLDLKELIYESSVNNIFETLIDEIHNEMNDLLESGNEHIRESISEGKFNVQNLEVFKSFQFYQKSIALHLCGFGDLIIDTFNNILTRYLEKK